MVDFIRRAHTVPHEAVAGGRSRGGGVPDVLGAVQRFFGSLNIWFWAIVGVPTLLAGVYFFGIASDLYVSEVKFVVRGPEQSPMSAVGAMMMLGSGGGGASEDTFAVHEFLMSRDAVRKLERSNNLRTVFSRPEGDMLTRFPGPTYWRRDFEALYRTYSHFVSVELDSSTGVSTLMVKAYRPEDAQNIARALLGYGEELVNQLNDRSRQAAVGTFEREVSLDQQRIADIQGKLTAYRVKEKMLDPKSAATGPLAMVAQLEAQLTTSRGQLADTIKNSPNAPAIPLIRTRIATLEKLVADERARVTGDANSVAASVTEYERLDLQRQLEERTLASAVSSLESARLQAQRRQIFLETIAQPNLADYPLYPRRFAYFATTAASCLLAYGIAWVLMAGIREHASA